MSRTHGHLTKDCIFYSPLQSVTVFGAMGGTEKKKNVRFLDYFLEDKVAVPKHPYFSYSWPRAAPRADLRPKYGSHILMMVQPPDQSEFLEITLLIIRENILLSNSRSCILRFLCNKSSAYALANKEIGVLRSVLPYKEICSIVLAIELQTTRTQILQLCDCMAACLIKLSILVKN